MTVRSVPARLIRALVVTTIFARPERTFLTLAASRRSIGKPAITAPARRITVLAARRTIFAVAGIRTPLALRLAGEAALGEFLLRPPRNARAALAARRTVAPAPRIVVFIVIAGHEGGSLRVRNKLDSYALFDYRSAFSRKTGIHFC
jgi:hypothetical protein